VLRKEINAEIARDYVLEESIEKRTTSLKTHDKSPTYKQEQLSSN